MKKLLYPLLLVLILVSGCDFFGGNEPPVAYIDSIAPADAAAGEMISFVGHGTDADGTVVAYRWRSSIDGDLSTAASFDSSTLSGGEHIIYLKVQDNNGAWSKEAEGAVVVAGAAAGLPAIMSFAASPSSISPGGTSTLSWEVANANTVSIDGGIGSVALSGTRAVAPVATTTYTLMATNATGSVTATAQVLVSGTGAGGAAGAPIINYFTADPETVSPGGDSTLSWSVSNADTVTISTATESVMVGSSGSIIARLTATTTFTLTATNASGGVTKTAIVSVGAGGSGGAAGSPTINYFTATPEIITAGESSELSWSVSNADIAWLGAYTGSTGSEGSVNPVGTRTVSPTVTTTYILTAGGASAEVVVTVEAAGPEEHTINVPLIASESGHVISGGEVVATQLAFGDLNDNRVMRAFLSFDISGLAGVEVVRAELNFAPGVVTGTPWPNLSPMQLCEANYGARGLIPSDFNMPATLAAPAFDSKPSGPINLTSRVQSKISSAAPRFQLQCRFAHTTDSDGHGDFWWTNASLSITYLE